MTETQKYLLDYLKFFDKFCRDNDIEYFLGGGTLLGAIRHRGFLPWDDDADLYIKSSEWERALEIFKTKLPERYQISSRETTPDYRNSIIRIADTETSAYYRSRLADNTAHGVQLELFRLDPIPDDKEKKEKFYGDYWTYTEAENPYAILNEGRLDYRKLSLDKYIKLEKAFHDGNSEITDAAKQALKFDEGECTMYHEDWASYWLVYPIKAFRNQIYVPFEDVMLPAPVGYADVLYGEYGDTWMMMPSAANRAFHDDVENYDIPYRYMEPIIEKQLDKKKYLKALRERKIRLVEKEFNWDKIIRKRLELEDEYLNIKYSSEQIKTKINQAFENQDWQGLMEIVSPLVDRQWEAFNNSYIFHIDEDIMYKILYACFMQGEFKYIARIEQYIEFDSCFDSYKKIQIIFNDLKRLRKIRFSYYYNEMEGYREEHREMLQKYPTQIYLNILDIIYRMRENEDPMALIEEVHALEERAGVTPRLRKLEADLLMKSGKTEEAEAICKELLMTSLDGMVNNEIINMQ